MADARTPYRCRGQQRSGFTVAAALLSLGLLLAATAGARASPYPALPQAQYTQFLEDLNVAPLAPGSSGPLTFAVHNPLQTALGAVTVSLEFYAFNPSPGNSPQTLPNGSSPEFMPIPGGPPSEAVTFAVTSLATNATVSETTLVEAPTVAASGTYAIRTSVAFNASGASYLLRSRGYFSEAQWANATEAPNGNATLNVSRLGVSGVTPETGVLVRTNAVDYLLWGLLAASLVLAGLAAFYMFRRGPGSRSGARGSGSPQSAPNALGNKRTKDGD